MENNKLFKVYEYNCKLCNKEYSCYQSLWNHNKKYHTNECTPNVFQSIPLCTPIVSQTNESLNKYQCKYCDNNYSSRQNRWKHEQKCKDIKKEPAIKDAIKLEEAKLKVIKEENKKLLLEVTNKKIENRKLELELRKNKTEIVTNGNSNTINNNSNNNTNNGTINNTFVQHFNISYKKLSNKDKKEIVSNIYDSLKKSILKIHFNEKIPEYNNIFITSLRDQFAYTFNGSKFSAVIKNDLINDLIDIHIAEMYSFIKYNPELLKKFSGLLERFNNYEYRLYKNKSKFIDENEKVHKNFREFVIESLKLLIYNNSDKNKLENIKKLPILYEKAEEIDNSDDE